MSKRIDDVEILRGFAVLFVAVHHALGNLFTWSTPGLERFGVYFSGGFGVDLFFVISGFVIARELVPRLQKSSSSDVAFRIVVAFWIRRAWRLLPSAWLWLALTLLAVVLFNQSGVFGSFRTNLEATVAGVLQVANLRFAETFGQSPYGTSFVYWSLSLEEQFYLALPLLVLLTRRFLPHILIALVILQLLSMRTLLTIVFRTDAIALGVLLALWSQHSTYFVARPIFLASRWGGWLSTLALLVLLFCMAIIGSTVLHVVSYPFSLYAVLSVFLVWMASYNMNLFMTGPLKQIMLWVGSRSYAIYLIHVPAFFLTRELWSRLRPGKVPNDDFFFPLMLTAVVLIIFLCELNYRLVETPFRRRGAQISQAFLDIESVKSVTKESSIN